MMEREGEKRHLHVTGVGHAGDLHNDVIEPSIVKSLHDLILVRYLLLGGL